MFLRMVFGFVIDLFWWINSVVNDYFDPITPPTKDLSEIARIGINRKLKVIRQIYNNYEFDIRQWGFRFQSGKHSGFPTTQSQSDLKPRMNIEPNKGCVRFRQEMEPVTAYTQMMSTEHKKGWNPGMIHGDSDVLVQGFGDSDILVPEYPEIELIAFLGSGIFRGQSFGKKLVSVKRREKADTIHIRVAAKLSHHENILNHLFDFQYGAKYYTVSENFEHSLSRNFVPENLKHLTRHICSGLEYLHKKGIAHGKIKASNVMVCHNRNRITYKIANFENAVTEAPGEMLARDVKKLGKLLMVFRFNIENAKEQDTYGGSWNQSDDYCLYDLVEKNCNGNCMIQKIKKHSFLWSVHETLMFVVEIVKTMEPYGKAKKYDFVSNMFKSCSEEVLSGVDWRSMAPDIVAIQTKTNEGRRPPKEFIGLLKMIRNLVRPEITVAMFECSFIFL